MSSAYFVLYAASASPLSGSLSISAVPVMTPTCPPVCVALKLTLTCGWAAMLRSLALPGSLPIRISSSRQRNHTGVGAGVPDAATVVSQTTRSSSSCRAMRLPKRVEVSIVNIRNPSERRAEAAPLDCRAVVHHHGESGRGRPVVGVLVDYVELEPHRLRVDSDRLVRDVAGQVGVDEHVHAVDRERDVR